MSVPPLDIEDALRDLGDHLDLGPGDTEAGRTQLVSDVLERLPATATAPPTPSGDLGAARRRRLGRRVLVAAAIVVVVLAGLLAVTPTRDAIARWLGIGGVRLTVSDDAPPDGRSPAPGAPAAGNDPVAGGAVDLDALAGSLPFPIRIADPAVAGELRAAIVDPTVGPGLVELRYDGVTLVQVGSRPGAAPVLDKVLGPGTTTTAVTVDGRPGFWLAGAPHQVGSIDPGGELRLDSVRRAGEVLLWEDDGVTYRIEGAPSLEAAQAIAASLR